MATAIYPAAIRRVVPIRTAPPHDRGGDIIQAYEEDSWETNIRPASASFTAGIRSLSMNDFTT
jgi:hypothetical protein